MAESRKRHEEARRVQGLTQGQSAGDTVKTSNTQTHEAAGSGDTGSKDAGDSTVAGSSTGKKGRR